MCGFACCNQCVQSQLGYWWRLKNIEEYERESLDCLEQTVSGNADFKNSANEDCLPACQQWLLCSVQMQGCVWGGFVLAKFCLMFCLPYHLTTAAFILVETAVEQDGLEQVPSVGQGALEWFQETSQVHKHGHIFCSSASSALFLGVSKCVCSLFMTLDLLQPFDNSHWFSNQLSGFIFLLWTPGLGCPICDWSPSPPWKISRTVISHSSSVSPV